MKKIFVGFLAVMLISVSASAVDEDVEACLNFWGKHPFDRKNPKYRTISAKVKVLGIGGDVKDEAKTEGPDLVLIKPTVSVMAKTKYKLLNPNGWYCMKGGVSVLGKTAIDVHCKAHLASSKDGVAVLGANDDNSGGVAVLGSVRINKIGCEE